MLWGVRAAAGTIADVGLWSTAETVYVNWTAQMDFSGPKMTCLKKCVMRKLKLIDPMEQVILFNLQGLIQQDINEINNNNKKKNVMLSLHLM